MQNNTRAADLLELAWGLLANVSGGDWQKQSPDWQTAAGRWRQAWEDYTGERQREAKSPVPSNEARSHAWLHASRELDRHLLESELVDLCYACAPYADQLRARHGAAVVLRVYKPAEPGAGLPTVNDRLVVVCDSGQFGGGPGEFRDYLIEVLRAWYDGASVTDAGS